MAARRRIILFGDSLTQQSFSANGWGAAVADAFQRKADVVNRGYSGYNTNNAMHIFHTDFPQGSLKDKDVVVVCFGANDSALEAFDQHVPLERYTSNMADLIEQFFRLGIQRNHIVMMSPPPVDLEAWVSYKVSDNKDDGRDRLNTNTKLYAEASVKVAETKGCVFIDLWSAFMQEKNWKSMFCDGLHFNDTGNHLVSKLLMKKLGGISESWKEYHPDWKEFYNKN